MTSRIDRQKLLDDLHNDVRAYIVKFRDNGVGAIDGAMVTDIIHYTMAVVETGKAFAKLEGADKRSFVITVVIDIVREVLDDPIIAEKLPQQARDAIEIALASVPIAIEVAVGFANNIANDNGAASADDGVAKSGCCFKC